MKPSWTPTCDPALDVLYLAKWYNRTLLETGDHESAPGSTACFMFERVGPGLSWAMLKLLWREEEVRGGFSCHLCAKPQLLYSFWFGGQFGRGTLQRRCPACSVHYVYEGTVGLVFDPVQRAADALGYVRAPKARMEFRRSVTSERWPAAPSPEHDGPMVVLGGDEAVRERQRVPLAGRSAGAGWTLEVPRQAGSFWVASSGGKARAVRRVEWDGRAECFREVEKEPWFGWWWGEPV